LAENSCIPIATNGGWILGNKIDGTQAEFVRIPYAETSLYPVPAGADEEAWAMLSHFLPTGFECGVLNGKIQPGDSVAIVGSRSPSRSFG
jgi:alcohol dehydrogenase